jgi:hypothetical protein
MKEINLNKSVLKLPDSWEDLSFKQKLFTFTILNRVMEGDLKAQPHTGLFNLLIEFTGYRPSKKYFLKWTIKFRFWLKAICTYIRNIPFFFKYGKKEFREYIHLWKKIYHPDLEIGEKRREIINFNLLRLSEQIKFVFTIDESEYKIIPHYDFKTNPFPYIKIGRKKYYGKRFELDITAKTDVTAREFVDSFDLLVAIDKMTTDEEKQECINQLCAILYPKTNNYMQNSVSLHDKAMRKVNPIVKFGIVYWFTGIVKFYTEHPIYSLLFNGNKSDDDSEEKVRLGSEVILMLQKEGYGLPDSMNLNDYFDAQIKHLKDVIGKALGEGLSASKISQKTGIDIETINRLS